MNTKPKKTLVKPRKPRHIPEQNKKNIGITKKKTKTTRFPATT